MATVEHTWPASAFDAIGIRTRDSQFTIEGIDGDQVKLKSDYDEKSLRNLMIGPVGRWLQIHSSAEDSHIQFTLQLPKHKAWHVDVFSGKAQFKAGNIQARLNLMLGKGEIEVENCRGALSVFSSKANIRLKYFTEAEMPEAPPQPGEWPRIKQEDPASWPDWWADYWTQLGEESDERIVRRFFRQAGGKGQNPWINLQIGKGDLQVEDIEARELTARFARGDVKLKGGYVANFDLNIIKGNFQCESCLPAGDWDIRVNRGDIHLSLPSDTVARLDVATRQGDIQSKMPMVRVTRQGPEAWHGGRMVGTLGTNIEGKTPEIHLTTLHGDIKIEAQPMASRYHAITGAERASSSEFTTGNADSYNTPLAVLKALSEGRIGVEEADLLLRSLDS